MTVLFPSLKPSNRTIIQGLFPVKAFKSIVGKTVYRRYGKLSYNSFIELEYAHIPDADAYSLSLIFDQAYGTFDSITLPTEFWDDIEDPLQTTLKDSYTWRFAEAPSITKSEIPGYKSVSIKLEGQRD